jgi:hypothetical protein
VSKPSVPEVDWREQIAGLRCAFLDHPRDGRWARPAAPAVWVCERRFAQLTSEAMYFRPRTNIYGFHRLPVLTEIKKLPASIPRADFPLCAASCKCISRPWLIFRTAFDLDL